MKVMAGITLICFILAQAVSSGAHRMIVTGMSTFYRHLNIVQMEDFVFKGFLFLKRVCF